QAPVSLFEQSPTQVHTRTPSAPAPTSVPDVQAEPETPAQPGTTASELLRRRRKPGGESDSENIQPTAPGS
ncbi:MAG TPA: hypothetical protein VGK81_02515, partial [Anaerolineae bacterium]